MLLLIGPRLLEVVLIINVIEAAIFLPAVLEAAAEFCSVLLLLVDLLEQLDQDAVL
jgi:hypothetical protein